MKLVISIIRPHKLTEVKEALAKLNVSGMTVSEVKGFGKQRGHTELYRGGEYTIEFVPKIKIETVISDEKLTNVLKTISQVAQTGKIGDGKIFVLPVEKAIRIRTGETGPEAL